MFYKEEKEEEKEDPRSPFTSPVISTKFGRIVGHTSALASTALNNLESYYNSDTKEQSVFIKNLYTFVHEYFENDLTYENLKSFIEDEKINRICTDLFGNNLLGSIQNLFNIQQKNMGRSREPYEVTIQRATVFLRDLLTIEHPDTTPANYDEVEARIRFDETEEQTNNRLRRELEERMVDGGEFGGGGRRKRSKKSRNSKKSKKSRRSRKSKRSKKSRRR